MRLFLSPHFENVPWNEYAIGWWIESNFSKNLNVIYGCCDANEFPFLEWREIKIRICLTDAVVVSDMVKITDKLKQEAQESVKLWNNTESDHFYYKTSTVL